MTRSLSAQALRYSAFLRPFARDVGPATFLAYRHAMLAKKERRLPGLSKLKQIELAISRPEGASLFELMSLTGWQAHSVRGAISAELRKRRGLAVVLRCTNQERRYQLS